MPEIIEFTRDSWHELERTAPNIAEALMSHVLSKFANTIKRLTHENHLLLRDSREVVDEKGNIKTHEEDDDDDEQADVQAFEAQAKPTTGKEAYVAEQATT